MQEIMTVSILVLTKLVSPKQNAQAVTILNAKQVQNAVLQQMPVKSAVEIQIVKLLKFATMFSSNVLLQTLAQVSLAKVDKPAILKQENAKVR